MRFKISSESRSAVESVGDAVCGRRKFSTIYIDHTEGSKKTNSGWESYDDFRPLYIFPTFFRHRYSFGGSRRPVPLLEKLFLRWRPSSKRSETRSLRPWPRTSRRWRSWPARPTPRRCARVTRRVFAPRHLRHPLPRRRRRERRLPRHHRRERQLPGRRPRPRPQWRSSKRIPGTRRTSS